jgi:predicted nuclease of restriction endonuclease-like (RecB) superfamily
VKAKPKFFDEIRDLIAGARTTVARGVDLLQVHTNFEIDRRIVEEEQRGKGRAAYGEEIIKALAERLTTEFGRGFSLSNLKSMRQFYLQNHHRISQTPSGQFNIPSKSQTLSGQSPTLEPASRKSTSSRIRQTPSDRLAIIQSPTGKSVPPPRPSTLSWPHYVFLLGIKNLAERSFYEIETGQQNWTVRKLKRQSDSGLYERLALSRDKAGIRRLAREGQTVAQVRDLLKEPLILEFLGLDERTLYTESDLESAIIGQIERFLLEMGKGFVFEARQKRFTFDAEHFFVDLVFYNRLPRCYVLLDLKIGRITHQDLGQMQMYVFFLNYFDRFVKASGENSTIGIVLCKQRNKALVEITLPKDANVHAREYRLYLPSKNELQQKLMEWIEARGGDEERAGGGRVVTNEGSVRV